MNKKYFLVVLLTIFSLSAIGQDEEFQEISPNGTVSDPNEDLGNDDTSVGESIGDADSISNDPEAQEPSAEFQEPTEEAQDLNLIQEEQQNPDISAEEFQPLAPVDNPDIERETRFFEIYKTYNEQPISSEQWVSILKNRDGENYIVQLGDTLWDISIQFFGDGNYWSKIWALNEGIENPHEITIGQTIRFYAGTVESEPSVEILDGEQASEEKKTEKRGPGPKIPPPAKVYRPPLTKIPPSLPPFRPEKKSQEYDPTGFSIDAHVKTFGSPTVHLSSYLAGEVPKTFGVISEVELGEEFATTFQQVFVKLDQGASSSGVYQVVRRVATIHPNPEEDEIKAHIIEVQGSLRIQELVNPARGIYKAIVFDAINPVTKGSILVEGSLKKVSMDLTGAKNTTPGTIIGGQYDGDRKLFGLGSIIFIDLGKNSGIQNGDLMDVTARRSMRNKETEVILSTHKVGMIRIGDVQDNYATGIVVESREDIHRGDFVGSGNEGNVEGLKDNDGVPITPSQGLSADEIDGEGDEFSEDDEDFGDDEFDDEEFSDEEAEGDESGEEATDEVENEGEDQDGGETESVEPPQDEEENQSSEETEEESDDDEDDEEEDDDDFDDDDFEDDDFEDEDEE